ncbi:MAG: NAD-dependent epimerase/dehydratase family protein, partial [Thalassobaculaceae bacterium]
AAAAVADHEPGGGDPDRYLCDNVIAAQNLAAWAASGQVGAILMLSSLSVYGVIAGDTVAPDSPIDGPGLYGASKLFAERILAAHSGGVPMIAARLPGVIGPAPPRNWLSGVLAKLRTGAEVTIFNPEAPFNNAVHVDDLATWAGHLAGAPWRGCHVVTLGAAASLTVAAVVEHLRAALASSAPIVTRPAPRPSFQISIAAAERFGFKPMTMAAALDRFVRENRGGDV